MNISLHSPWRGRTDRRRFLQMASLGVMAGCASGWFPALAAQLAERSERRRQCILLWMAGGPSQTDTFDMKPGHVNGGSFKEIATNVPGVRFCEHLPRLATMADKLAVVRSLNTKEGDHQRGTYLARTGHTPGDRVAYPPISASLAKELGRSDSALPNLVTILPALGFGPAAFGPGFLGPKFAPATVAELESQAAGEEFPRLGMNYLQPPGQLALEQMQRRRELWARLQEGYLAAQTPAAAVGQDTAYRQAMRLMESEAVSALDLSQEPVEVREKYGRSRFGQGCLLARRLIERGVPFVEVTLGPEQGTVGWDTHEDNFEQVRSLCGQLDSGWASLMAELDERGLLESTTILWIGEFGRTPQINMQTGRDHFPDAWTCVFAGGGIAGGQTYGQTSPDGLEVVEGQVAIGDCLATLCEAVGVDPTTENYTELGRPIRIAEGEAIRKVLS